MQLIPSALGKIARRAARRGGPPYAEDTYNTLAALRRWNRDDLIIDVGANDGRSILRWRRHLGPTRVMAFEPVSATFARLQQATEGMDGVRLFRTSLGETPGTLPIFLHEHAALNSFLPGQSASGAQEMVAVETLDHVLEREGVSHAELLKIDAEGFDLEVLRGATDALATRRFDIIQVEAGFDAPGPAMTSLADIQSLLAGHRYFLHRITNQCGARLGKLAPRRFAEGANPDVLVYCDAIFVAG